MLTSILLAVAAISRNRLRSTLTTLGILIGVAALISVTSLATGVSRKISGSLEPFASKALTIDSQTPDKGSNQALPHPLTESDARAIAREGRRVTAAAAYLSAPVSVVFGDRNESTQAVGTQASYFAIRQLRFASGAPWTDEEEARKSKVCVLGSYLSEQLFGGMDPLGRIVRIGRSPCRIVGVLRSQGASPMGENPDDVLLTPIGSFRARIRPTSPGRADKVLVAVSSSSTQRAENEIKELLRQRHRIRQGAPDDFSIKAARQMQEVQLAIAAALSALLLCIASVSLVVGGIGVMNIMLVSVAERTREIGIRLSIGARSGDILRQFLVEAIVLSSLGGIFGLMAGVVASFAFGRLLSLPLAPSATSALLAVGTSIAIGVFFGFLPARRAAALDPIEALRAE